MISYQLESDRFSRRLDRRQLFHTRRQHDSAVYLDREQRRALERKPHRASQRGQGSRLLHFARRPLGPLRRRIARVFGVNATIRDSVRIAEGSLIAMAASVTKDTEPWGVYKGNPARKDAVSSRDLDF